MGAVDPLSDEALAGATFNFINDNWDKIIERHG